MAEIGEEKMEQPCRWGWAAGIEGRFNNSEMPPNSDEMLLNISNAGAQLSLSHYGGQK